MNQTPTPEDLQRAREILYDLSQLGLSDNPEEFLSQTISKVRAEQIAADLRIIENAPCNKYAKYTCCLENGLNARLIIVQAVHHQKQETVND